MIDVALAIDIGGTKVEAALVDASGIRRGTRIRRATGPAIRPEALAASLVEIGREASAHLLPDDVLVGVGVGAAGPLTEQGRSVAPLNMPALGAFPLASTVESAFATVPVRVALDGTCIALAEYASGALSGCTSAVAMVVSTGIGGGIILDGRISVGPDGNAGHVGQIWVREPHSSEPVDATMEGIASGPATLRFAQAKGWRGADGHDLAASYATRDPIAVAAVTRSATAVGYGIAGLAAVLDLERVAIGGGFSHVAYDYVELVAAAVHDVAILPAARRVDVVRAAHANDAPLLGAAQLVLDPTLVSA